MDRDLVTTTFFSLAMNNGAAPEWVQLTPVSKGAFTRLDGGTYRIDDADAVIAASPLPIGIDYDHATDLAAKEGGRAPAAGWIEQLASHGPGNEPGIWGRVKWTPRGAQSIADGEYRGISPALFSNKATGAITRIFRAGLTNDPALNIKSLFSIQELATPMNRNQLCAMLGLPQNAADGDIHAAAKKTSGADRKKLNSALGLSDAATDDDTLNAVKKVGVQSSTMNARSSSEAVALNNIARILEAAGLSGELDETATVALCTKLKQSAGAHGAGGDLQKTVDDLQKQVATLNAKLAGRDAETEVAAAIAAGKLAPAQKDWAVSYCTRDPQGFRDFIANAPTVVVNGRIASEAAPEDGLTAAEKQICAKLGIKEDAYKAERATMKRSA